MSDPDGYLLVLGIGNVLLRDEGVGVRVAEALLEGALPVGSAGGVAPGLPAHTRVVDGGTLGLDLLPLVEGARAVCFVDAIDAGLQPGSVVVLREGDVDTLLSQPISAHDVGLAELIATARFTGALPRCLAIVGVQPAQVSPGLQLSPVVQAALPRAVDFVRREAWRHEHSGGRDGSVVHGRADEPAG